MVPHWCTVIMGLAVAILPGMPVHATDRAMDRQTGLAMKIAGVLASDTENRGQNLVLSPFGLTATLALLHGGAEQDTEATLSAALGFEGNGLDQFLALGERLGRNKEITIASGMWFDARNRPYGYTAYGLSARFGIPARILDLSKPEAGTKINEWAAEKTHGAIRQIFERLPANADWIAVNALHFKGRWATRFDSGETQDGAFRTFAGVSHIVPFMRREDDAILYRRSREFEAVDLPYEGGRFSLVALLPSEGAGDDPLATLLAGKTTKELDQLLSWLSGVNFKPARGTIEIPRFTLSSSHDLLPVLSQELVTEPEASRAEKGRRPRQLAFPGLSPSAAFTTLRQVATFTLDEEGTEAAAVTTGFGSRSVRRSDFHLRFNRPFIVALRDVESGTVLFLALVQDPGGRVS